MARAAPDVLPAKPDAAIESDYYAAPMDVKERYAEFLRKTSTV
ncbi:MAG: hypothetical protein ACREJX_18990 [Polyangiaceae bacterium]